MGHDEVGVHDMRVACYRGDKADERLVVTTVVKEEHAEVFADEIKLACEHVNRNTSIQIDKYITEAFTRGG